MDVKQIYTLVNDVTKEVLGQTDLIQEDLSGVVDLGTAIFNANQVENYTKTLVDRIGRTIFVNRVYKGSAPSVLMSSWEYGSVTQKIKAELPEAQENESWELESGSSYDTNIFTAPVVSCKFFNNKTTFEIAMSFTEKQIKSAFTSVENLNAFLSMIENEIDKSMTVKIDALIMRTINNMIGETIYDEYSGGSYSATSGVRAVNLLKLYNTRFSSNTITKAQAMTTPEFIRFATYIIGMYKDRIGKMSTLFNVSGKARFTPDDALHVVLLSDFENASKSYLQSGTFNKELVALPQHETVPYWQGSGDGYEFGDVSKISLTTSGNHSVTLDGIIGVMFDRDALGVTNYDRRMTSNYNGKGEFLNMWFKADCGYFNDLDENCVVFFVQ